MAQKLMKIGDKLRGKMRMLSVLCMTTMLCLQPALATNGTTAGDTIWTRFSDIMVSPPSWRSLQLPLHCWCA